VVRLEQRQGVPAAPRCRPAGSAPMDAWSNGTSPNTSSARATKCDADTSSPSPSSRPPRPMDGAPRTAHGNAPTLRTLNGGVGALGRLRDDTVTITGAGWVRSGSALMSSREGAARRRAAGHLVRGGGGRGVRPEAGQATRGRLPAICSTLVLSIMRRPLRSWREALAPESRRVYSMPATGRSSSERSPHVPASQSTKRTEVMNSAENSSADPSGRMPVEVGGVRQKAWFESARSSSQSVTRPTTGRPDESRNVHIC